MSQEKKGFRDFAGQVMGGNIAGAASVLEELLGLDHPAATRAAEFFTHGMSKAGNAFLGTAMGLRGAVEAGDHGEIRRILGACFGLEGEPLERAAALTRSDAGRY